MAPDIVWQSIGRVTLCAENRPLFGAVPKEPGLYRITFDDQSIYIGQTGDLRRRLSEYRRPTDGNVGEEILCHAIREAGGGHLDIFVGSGFSDARDRRRLEAAAIKAAMGPGVRLLNRTGHPNKLRIVAEIAVLKRRIADLEAEMEKLKT